MRQPFCFIWLYYLFALSVQVVVDIADVSFDEFIETMLSVVAAQTGLAHALMEALERLKVLAVYIGLTEVKLIVK